MPKKLSPHFTLDEFLISQDAVRHGIENTPNQYHIDNLGYLARTLEDIRLVLGHPIIISSGFRSPELNKAILGSDKSAHMDGLAADFICPGYGSPYQVCKAISGMKIPFDQLINEFGRWVHLGLSETGKPQRNQLLTAKKQNKITIYSPGLEAI